jgi:hypothetical protein
MSIRSRTIRAPEGKTSVIFSTNSTKRLEKFISDNLFRNILSPESRCQIVANELSKLGNNNSNRTVPQYWCQDVEYDGFESYVNLFVKLNKKPYVKMNHLN